MAYLALRTELTTYQRDHISRIHQTAQSLLDIINDILDFSKVEAGKLELEQARFSLEDALSASLSLILPARRRKKLNSCWTMRMQSYLKRVISSSATGCGLARSLRTFYQTRSNSRTRAM